MCKYDTCIGARNVQLFRLETWKELPLRFASRTTFDYNLTPLSFPTPHSVVRTPGDRFFLLEITSTFLHSGSEFTFNLYFSSGKSFPKWLIFFPLYREYYFPVTIAAKAWIKTTFLRHSLSEAVAGGFGPTKERPDRRQEVGAILSHKTPLFGCTFPIH